TLTSRSRTLRFNQPARPEIYTLSLHDALPIFKIRCKMTTRPGEQFVIRRKAFARIKRAFDEHGIRFAFPTVQVAGGGDTAPAVRSEEHTSELQSRENLVCRLLLEKKKKKMINH